MMTFGSLFSGIGGMDLGLERSGMRCAWHVENDEYASKILAKHWPDVPNFGNVETFPAPNSYCWSCESWGKESEREEDWRAASRCDCGIRVDLIAGGFPCQPVSLAGRRQAERDPRWLWPHFARIVRVLRPRYVLVENVPGLLVAGHGGLGVLADLAEMGYDAEWATLPASAFGAPHLRERVFIVAYACVVQSGKRHDADVQQRRPETPEQVGLGSWSDGDSSQARIFRSGREIAALPLPCWGTDQPGVARTLDGVPHRMDRIRGIGNAVVPQVAEWIGRRIIEAASA